MNRLISSVHLTSPCLHLGSGPGTEQLRLFKKMIILEGDFFFFLVQFALYLFSAEQSMQNFAHSPWSTNVFAGKMTSCMPLIAHLGKPGPHIFRWFLVQKHINSKKPISFFLNSMSSTIWPHFLLFLSVTLVGSPFSGLACAVQPVAFASVLFLSCQDHLSSFLH